MSDCPLEQQVSSALGEMCTFQIAVVAARYTPPGQQATLYRVCGASPNLLSATSPQVDVKRFRFTSS